MYIETHYRSCGQSVYGDMEIRFHRGVALYKGLSYILYVAKGIGTEVHWMTSTVSNTDMKLHGLHHYSSRVTASIKEKDRMHEFLQHT